MTPTIPLADVPRRSSTLVGDWRVTEVSHAAIYEHRHHRHVWFIKYDSGRVEVKHDGHVGGGEGCMHFDSNGLTEDEMMAVAYAMARML